MHAVVTKRVGTRRARTRRAQKSASAGTVRAAVENSAHIVATSTSVNARECLSSFWESFLDASKKLAFLKAELPGAVGLNDLTGTFVCLV